MIIMPGVLVHTHNPGSQRPEDPKAILSYKHEVNVREDGVKLL